MISNLRKPTRNNFQKSLSATSMSLITVSRIWNKTKLYNHSETMHLQLTFSPRSIPLSTVTQPAIVTVVLAFLISACNCQNSEPTRHNSTYQLSTTHYPTIPHSLATLTNHKLEHGAPYNNRDCHLDKQTTVSESEIILNLIHLLTDFNYFKRHLNWWTIAT